MNQPTSLPGETGGEEYANVEASTRHAPQAWKTTPQASAWTSCAAWPPERCSATALLAERRAYLDAHAELVDQTGKRLVVGNGYAKERQVMTGAGMVEVKAPRGR